MLDVQHRVVVADGGDQAALGVVRRGRRDHLQAGHVHEEAVQPLRVLRPLAPALADHRAHHQRHVHLAAVHVAALGGDVDELVHRQHQEVHADVDVDRPQPGQRHADGRAGHGVLGQRRAEDALGAVLLHAGRASCPGSPWDRPRPGRRAITDGSRAISWSVASRTAST